jgi:hypothetical protein
MPNFIQLYNLQPIIFSDGYDTRHHGEVFLDSETALKIYQERIKEIKNPLTLSQIVINRDNAGKIRIGSYPDPDKNNFTMVLNTDFGQIQLNYLERKITVLENPEEDKFENIFLKDLYDRDVKKLLEL